jgi:hypothetical protein
MRNVDESGAHRVGCDGRILEALVDALRRCAFPQPEAETTDE